MRSARRASSATRWPSATSALAVAAPIPEEAPVMTATRPMVVLSVVKIVPSGSQVVVRSHSDKLVGDAMPALGEYHRR